MPIDFRVADFCHPLRIWRLRRTLERTQWMPADELQGYQDARVRAVVTHAASGVPYYRELFGRLSLQPADIAGAADLARLPVLDKQVLRDRPEELLLTLLPRYRAEGKSYVSVAFGCTGGRHRSVHVAERVANRLRGAGFSPTVEHRDLATPPRDGIERSAGASSAGMGADDAFKVNE